MSFLQLIRREMQGSLPRLAVMSGLSGFANAAILTAINSGAEAASSGEVSLSSAGFFIIALILFVKTQHYTLIAATAEIEAIIHRLRVRLLDEVRRTELLPLEEIGRAEIVAAITKNTATLAQAGGMFAFAAQAVVLITFVALYVAYLSPLAFVLSVLIVGAAAGRFHAKTHELAMGTREAAAWENRLFDRFMDVLDGFKEVRLNRTRSDDLFKDVLEVSRTAANIKIRTQGEALKRVVFSQGSAYVLLGAMVFVVPAFSSDTLGASIQKTTMALLYVVASCFGLVQSLPLFTAANAAADNIEQLETKLRTTVTGAPVSAVEPRKSFDTIEMRNVVFRYVDKSSEATFQVGPVDFTLRSGDLVFITGGNGSGKSTFLKLLAGLYKPESGEITLDGVQVTDNERDAYRALIAAIFSDYHLFHRLYGIPDPDPAEINRLLAQFRLLDKTSVTNGEFRTLDLSGGQRKRLALIVSLLEKRPILLLDEWTAEQDPEFRRKFYDELLPQLTQTGATVVVITHDERFLDEWHLPARRLRMDEGRFVEQR